MEKCLLFFIIVLLLIVESDCNRIYRKLDQILEELKKRK